jgi:hypothetical protein
LPGELPHDEKARGWCINHAGEGKAVYADSCAWKIGIWGYA